MVEPPNKANPSGQERILKDTEWLLKITMIDFATPESTILEDQWGGFPFHVIDYRGLNRSHQFIYGLNSDQPWLGNVKRDGCNRLQLFFRSCLYIQKGHGYPHLKDNLNITRCGCCVICKNEVEEKATISGFEKSLPISTNQD